MPVPNPPQYIAMQPALRHSDEAFRATVQIAWSPGDGLYVVAVTVVEGEDPGDLRSEVVGPLVGPLDLGWVLRTACSDLLGLVARSENPFDDLV